MKTQNTSNLNLLDLHRERLAVLRKKLIPQSDVDNLQAERQALLGSNIKEVDTKNRIMSIDDNLSDAVISQHNYQVYLYATADVVDKYCAFDASQHKIEMSINDFFRKQQNPAKIKSVTRRQLLDRYFVLTENFAPMDTSAKQPVTCEYCNEQMVLSRSGDIYVCVFCGNVCKSLVDCALSGNIMQQNYIKSSIYHRKNHLKEWLNQIQAKETVDVPTHVIDTVLVELKNMGVTDLSALEIGVIRKILKKKRLSKFYEHSAYILYTINGIRPKTMPPHVEKKILAYFKQIEEPFSRLKKGTRKNILRYSYIIHKLCELLDIDDFVPKQYTLLKSRSKLIEQDAIWKLICNDLNWQFIPSV